MFCKDGIDDFHEHLNRLQVAGQNLNYVRTVNATVILKKKKTCLYSVT